MCVCPFAPAVNDECGSDGDEERSTDAMVEEMLQQGDTAVIYPEAPEDEPRQGTPEASIPDENGKPLPRHARHVDYSSHPPHQLYP